MYFMCHIQLLRSTNVQRIPELMFTIRNHIRNSNRILTTFSECLADGISVTCHAKHLCACPHVSWGQGVWWCKEDHSQKLTACWASLNSPWNGNSIPSLKKSLPFLKVMGELGTAQYCLQHPSKWWEYEFCPLCLRRIDYPTLNPWLFCIFCLFLYCIVVPGHQQRVSEDTKNLQMLGSLLENSVCIEFIHIFSHTLSHLYLQCQCYVKH